MSKITNEMKAFEITARISAFIHFATGTPLDAGVRAQVIAIINEAFPGHKKPKVSEVK
jgi:hypothetical protein